MEKVRNSQSSSAQASSRNDDGHKTHKDDPERGSRFNALLGRGAQPASPQRPAGDGQGVGRHGEQKGGQEGFTLGGKTPSVPVDGRGARHGLPVGHEGERGFGRGGGFDDPLGRLAAMEGGAGKKAGIGRPEPGGAEPGGKFLDLLGGGTGQGGDLAAKPRGEAPPPQVTPREDGGRQGALAAGAARGREEPSGRAPVKSGEGDRGRVEGQPGQAAPRSEPQSASSSAHGARSRDLELDDLRRRPMPRGFDREGLEAGERTSGEASLARTLAADWQRLEGPVRVEKPSRDLPGPAPGVEQVHRLLMGQGPNGAEARLVIDAGPFAGTSIHFKHGPGGVQAVIQAQNVSTQQTLAGALDEISKKLRDKGHTLDVKFQQAPRQQPEDQPHQQHPGQR